MNCFAAGDVTVVTESRPKGNSKYSGLDSKPTDGEAPIRELCGMSYIIAITLRSTPTRTRSTC